MAEPPSMRRARWLAASVPMASTARTVPEQNVDCCRSFVRLRSRPSQRRNPGDDRRQGSREMANVIKAALLQTDWTGDKESMIESTRRRAREAAAQGAQVICFQELFYGPYFCQVQERAVLRVHRVHPRARPPSASRPWPRSSGMVMVLPMYEEEQPGVLYNTAAVVDADGTLPRQVPQAPHPAGQGLLGEVLLPARQPRVPGVRHRGRQGRRLHLLRPALPRGLAGARPERRPASSSTRRPPAAGCRPTCGSSSSRRRPWPTSTSSAPSTGSASSPSATTTSTARRYFVDPEGKFVGEPADDHKPELIVRDLDMDLLADGPRPLGSSTGTAARTPTTTCAATDRATRERTA